jgi:hypothetical protein
MSGLPRRTFLTAAGLTAGVVAIGPFVRAALAASADRRVGDWHVDDICGHWPRYAHPIPYGHTELGPVSWDNVAAVDLMFMS